MTAPATAWLALILATFALTTLSACGDDDAAVDDPAAADADLQVRVDGITFDRTRYEVPAGSSTIAFEQHGGSKHTLLIDDVDGFGLEVDGAASDTGSVTLEPGTYTLYCDIPGHRDSGMEAELVVE